MAPTPAARELFVEYLLATVASAAVAGGAPVARPMTATAEQLLRDVASRERPDVGTVIGAMLHDDCMAQPVLARLRIAPWPATDQARHSGEALMRDVMTLANRYPLGCITTIHFLAAALLSADPHTPELAVLDNTSLDDLRTLLARWKPSTHPEFIGMFEPLPLAGRRLHDALDQRDRLAKTLGRAPTAAELSEQAGLTVDEARYALPFHRQLHIASFVPLMATGGPDTLTVPVCARPGDDIAEQISAVLQRMRGAGYRHVDTVTTWEGIISLSFIRDEGDPTSPATS